jgi:hypothetical protein
MIGFNPFLCDPVSRASNECGKVRPTDGNHCQKFGDRKALAAISHVTADAWLAHSAGKHYLRSEQPRILGSVENDCQAFSRFGAGDLLFYAARAATRLPWKNGDKSPWKAAVSSLDPEKWE